MATTASAYIPTSGSTVTRAADTSGLTIPAYSTTRTTGSELVTNGDFSTGDLTGWVDASGGLANSSVVSGQANINNAAADGLAGISRAFTTEVGKSYIATGSLISTTLGARFGVGVAANDVSLGDTGQVSTVGTHTLSFVATGTTTYVSIYTFPNGSPAANETSVWDNISVKEAARIAPWPTPRVIGEELVVNGGFDSDLSGWSESGGSGDWSWSTGRAKDSGTGPITLNQTITTEVGKVYLLSATAYDVSGGNPALIVGGNVLYQFFDGTSELSKSKAFVATSTSTVISLSGALATWEIDNISVKEIDPLAVCISVKGRATGDSYTTLRWYADANNYITQEIGTSDFTFEQAESGTVDSVTGGSFTSGVNVPFNVASYHGSTFVGGAVDGAALTANETPVALADMSSNDIGVGYDFMGNIEQVRIWVGGITDVTSGNLLISEASS